MLSLEDKENDRVVNFAIRQGRLHIWIKYGILNSSAMTYSAQLHITAIRTIAAFFLKSLDINDRIRLIKKHVKTKLMIK